MFDIAVGFGQPSHNDYCLVQRRIAAHRHRQWQSPPAVWRAWANADFVALGYEPDDKVPVIRCDDNGQPLPKSVNKAIKRLVILRKEEKELQDRLIKWEIDRDRLEEERKKYEKIICESGLALDSYNLSEAREEGDSDSRDGKSGHWDNQNWE
ncbi:hypothetical protein TREMEDRAFT_72530 [Tremella mesenterica DSM 1558]|uniref:uncharacterized protein n=1 Tax=Tremella mesenterica (strain ATCC 24925 / CBS 8224 / DSM 1558 / NBRC 9311 / NRRL Y-6157 / RJB 2259-6 / UBC 559-6) TaxID=578456 RepID=UPI00032C704A|nr:uncharacterized protein TREMEDRAFT_72530 [Tremella mesenterica DSM 1558]EIW65776.1 hypothetical protein TREMEDRAFT_72530 [Tremella mesenterica DSM 1558]